MERKRKEISGEVPKGVSKVNHIIVAAQFGVHEHNPLQLSSLVWDLMKVQNQHLNLVYSVFRAKETSGDENTTPIWERQSMNRELVAYLI